MITELAFAPATPLPPVLHGRPRLKDKVEGAFHFLLQLLLEFFVLFSKTLRNEFAVVPIRATTEKRTRSRGTIKEVQKHQRYHLSFIVSGDL